MDNLSSERIREDFGITGNNEYVESEIDRILRSIINAVIVRVGNELDQNQLDELNEMTNSGNQEELYSWLKHQGVEVGDVFMSVYSELLGNFRALTEDS